MSFLKRFFARIGAARITTTQPIYATTPTGNTRSDGSWDAVITIDGIPRTHIKVGSISALLKRFG